jgi:hypothetical protein
MCAGKARGLAIETVAGGALVAVDSRAHNKIVLVSLDGSGRGRLTIDARVERNPDDLALHWKRRVSYGHGRVPKTKPRQHRKRHQDQAQDESNENASHLSLRLPWVSSQSSLDLRLKVACLGSAGWLRNSSKLRVS